MFGRICLRVLIGVPNSQLTTIFSAKYQLTTIFFANPHLIDFYFVSVALLELEVLLSDSFTVVPKSWA